MSQIRPLATAIAAAAVALVLAGCAPTVALNPAADANNPGCASVIVRLPQTVGDMDRRQTDAQSTAAWGDPDAVILRCGVAVPTASTLPCVPLQGVQFLRDDTDKKYWKFTTFGTDPAIDVVVSRDRFTSPGIPLNELTNSISFLPSNGLKCTDPEDTVTGDDATPTPTPTSP